MNRFCDQFFSRSTFTVNINRRVKLGDSSNNVEHGAHFSATGDDVREIVFFLEQALEPFDL